MLYRVLEEGEEVRYVEADSEKTARELAGGKAIRPVVQPGTRKIRVMRVGSHEHFDVPKAWDDAIDEAVWKECKKRGIL